MINRTMKTSTRILIVEDEFALAEDLKLRLEKMGYVVEGPASTYEKAVDLLESRPIDLAILDIRIKGDKDGIDIGRTINSSFHIPFIFLTSYAIESVVTRAKAVNPSAYMLKPFNDRQISIAIELALVNFSQKKSASGVSEKKLIEDEPPVISIKDSLFLKKDDRFDRVSFPDILWLEAESNYTIIFTDKGKYVYSVVLKRMEEKLPKRLFMRVHRSFVINLSSVTGFVGNTLRIGSKNIPVSKQYQKSVFSHFNVI